MLINVFFGFGTHYVRVNTGSQKINDNNLSEKWYDMGDWKKSKASNNNCSKPLLINNPSVRTRTARKLEIKGKLKDSTGLKKSESKRMRFSLDSSQNLRIQRTPKKASSALELFNSFFSNKVIREMTPTPHSTSTTQSYSISSTTTITTTTTSPTIVPTLSTTVPTLSYSGDSDYIEILDYMDDRTGNCCW